MPLIQRITVYYHLLVRFLYRGLWEPSTGTARRTAMGIMRRMVLTTRLFLREGMTYRASALTYSTLLSVVPLLAILFAVAKGFGMGTLAEQWIRENIAAKQEMVDTLVGFVHSYLEHTKGSVFLGFGVLLLLWTLFNLTNSVETTFNRIWMVKQQRPVVRMITDYTAVCFLLPVFIVVSSGLTIYAYSAAREWVPDVLLLRPAALVLVRFLPYLVVCLFFTLLFAFIPNTRVRPGSALLSGVFTGLLFQLLQTCYVNSQLWLSSYNAIYGSFAALPLFMLMCQLSWTLTLFGGTLCYVDQNLHTFYYGHDAVHLSRLDRDCLSLRLAAAVCRRFADGQLPPTAEQLAEEEEIHLRIVSERLYDLEQAGIVRKMNGDTDATTAVYLPARDIHTLTVPVVLTALDRCGEDSYRIVDGPWQELYRQRREMFGQVFSRQPLHLYLHTPHRDEDTLSHKEDIPSHKK